MRLSTIKATYFDGSALRARLLSGSTWALGGKIAAAATGLVTNALLARMLTPAEFGAYFLAFSIISFGALVGALGLTKAVIRFIAENMGLNQAGRVRRAVYLSVGFGVLGSLVVGLSYWLVVGDLVGEYLFHSTFLVAITGLMAGWMAISVLQEITAETFRGFHDIRGATLLGGLATGGKSGGIAMRVLVLLCLAFLWVGNGETDLGTVMLIGVGSGSVSLLVGLGLLRAKVSSLGSEEETMTPVSAREVILDALPTLGISLTAFVMLSADIWILGALGSQQEVAVYGATSRLVALVALPLLVTNLVLPPIVTEMYAQGQTARLERTLRSFSTLAGAPSFLVLIGFMLLGGPILGLVYTDFYRGGATVLVLLSLAKMVAVWTGSCGTVLQFTGHQGSMLRLNLLTSPIFVVGALLVARDYGPVGVAAVAAATTVLQNVAMVLMAKRKTGMWTHVSFSLAPLRKALSKR